MLTLPGLREDAGTGSQTLEPSQSVLERFIIMNTYFRHLVFPPLALPVAMGRYWMIIIAHKPLCVKTEVPVSL